MRKKLLLWMLVSAAGLCAADLTGKWTGTADIRHGEGDSKSGPVFFNLKQNGSEISGAVGQSEEDTVAIRNGKLEGRKLTFEVVTQNGESFKFNLTFDGETITGEGGNERVAAKVSLKRAE